MRSINLEIFETFIQYGSLVGFSRLFLLKLQQKRKQKKLLKGDSKKHLTRASKRERFARKNFLVLLIDSTQLI